MTPEEFDRHYRKCEICGKPALWSCKNCIEKEETIIAEYEKQLRGSDGKTA